MFWLALGACSVLVAVYFRNLIDAVDRLQTRQITQLRRRQLDVYVEEREVRP